MFEIFYDKKYGFLKTKVRMTNTKFKIVIVCGEWKKLDKGEK